MPRRKKIITRTSTEIAAEIATVNEQITSLTAELKDLKTVRGKLKKEYDKAEQQEAKAEKAKEIQGLVELLHEKGLSVEELKDIIN